MAALRRGLAYPVAQLISAGLAFATWLTFSHLTPVNEQVLPIAAFTLGTPGALLVTLGISYLVPNYYRNAAMGARKRGGEWSEPVLMAAVLCGMVSILGVVLAALALRVHEIAIWSGTLGMAALIASGILVSQVGRCSDKFWLALVGAVATPSVAAFWLASTRLTSSESTGLLLANMLSLSLTAAILSTLAPTRIGAVAMSGPDRRSMVRRSVVLLPHLLLFGLLLQGLRIPAAMSGSSLLVVQAHQLMLVISVGFTFVSSINSYMGARLQSAMDAEYSQVRKTGVAVYALASVVAYLVVQSLWIILAAFDVIARPNAWATSSSSILLMFTCLGGYYAISAQFLRRAQTWPLLAASAAGFGILLTVSTYAGVADLGDLLIVVAAAVAAMSYALIVMASIMNRWSRLTDVSVGMIRIVLPASVVWGAALILG